MIKLTHPTAVSNKAELISLADDSINFNKFCDLLETRSCGKLSKAGYKQKAFEVFVEFFVKYFPDEMNLINYQNIKTSYATGISGIGINKANEIVSTKIKFRADNLLDEVCGLHRIADFTYNSKIRFGVNTENPKNCIIITNCIGLHHFADQLSNQDTVTCINCDVIDDLTANPEFWYNFRTCLEQVEESDINMLSTVEDLDLPPEVKDKAIEDSGFGIDPLVPESEY